MLSLNHKLKFQSLNQGHNPRKQQEQQADPERRQQQLHNINNNKNNEHKNAKQHRKDNKRNNRGEAPRKMQGHAQPRPQWFRNPKSGRCSTPKWVVVLLLFNSLRIKVPTWRQKFNRGDT